MSTPADGCAFITIVTYGRTGSTALQAAMNALPGVVVRGENYNALRGLHAYVQAIAETADRHHAGKPTHPWFGSARLAPAEVLADLRRHVVDYVLRPKPTTTWAGFKEVRYEPGHFPDDDALLDYLLFLDKLLPGLRFLFNVRDAQAAARSGWWPDNPDALEVLERTRASLDSAASELNRILGAGRAVVVDYDRWSEDPSVVIDAFDALGLPHDDDAVREALGQRLSHGPHAS